MAPLDSITAFQVNVHERCLFSKGPRADSDTGNCRAEASGAMEVKVHRRKVGSLRLIDFHVN